MPRPIPGGLTGKLHLAGDGVACRSKGPSLPPGPRKPAPAAPDRRASGCRGSARPVTDPAKTVIADKAYSHLSTGSRCATAASGSSAPNATTRSLASNTSATYPPRYTKGAAYCAVELTGTTIILGLQ